MQSLMQRQRFVIWPIWPTIVLLDFALLLSPVSGQERKVSAARLGRTVERSTVPVSFSPATVIGDSARMKLALVDLAYNIVGIGWEDREKMGHGKKKLVDFVGQIAVKYGHKSILEILTEDPMDLPRGLRTGGTVEPPDAGMSIELPDDKWYHIVPTKPDAKMPMVRFRFGTLSLVLNDMQVKFTPGTRAEFKEKQYVFRFVSGWSPAP